MLLTVQEGPPVQQAHLIFKYRPPGPPAGLPEQDMPTIYSMEANLGEVPDIGEIVSLPTEELDLPTSDTKERQGESEMGFKVVDRVYGTIPRRRETGIRPSTSPSLSPTSMPVAARGVASNHESPIR